MSDLLKQYASPGLVIANEWHQAIPALDNVTVDCVATLLRVTDLARAEHATILKRHGLNLTEYRVLAALGRSGGQHRMRMTDLFTSMLVTSSGMTKVISRLSRMGLLDCSISDDDKRVRVVKLTGKGLRLARMLVKTVYRDSTLIGAIGSLNKSDRKALERVLSHLHDAYSHPPEAD